MWLSFQIKSASDDFELASHTDLVQEKVNDLGISRLDVERELSRRSFAHFVREAWHVIEPSTKLKWGWAVEAICLHLQAVTEGEIQNLLAMVPPGTMKALDINTPIPTLDGWKAHGDLCEGDYVYGRDGLPRRVIAVSDHVPEPTFRLKFDDGAEIVAGSAHEWLIEREISQSRKYEEAIVETRGLRFGDRPHRLTLASAPTYRPPQGVLVDPYILGAWLGDGGSGTGCLYVGNQDIKEFSHLGKVTQISDRSERGQAFYRVTVPGLSKALRCLGLLENKHVPWQYEIGSVEQRIALIQGLFDTDGHCGTDGRPVFSNKNRQICDALVRVLSSLGLKPSIREKRSVLDGKDYGPYWQVACRPDHDISLFRLPRKAVRQKAIRQIRYKRRYLKSVQNAGLRMVNCIQVEGGLYLAGERHILTHNSLLVGVFWPAWEWGPRNMPHLRYIGTAHEETLAIRDNRRCRDLIKSPWYQKRWPMKMRADLDGKKEFGNDATGFRNARAFRSMTGARGDRVLLDDPIAAANANSMPKLKETELIFLETLPTRINDPEESSIVVIMQRLHQKDVAGIIIEKKLPYELLCIPMEFEPDRRCTTSIGWTDPRTEDGELMFPERFSRKTVETLKHNLGTYGAASQLQQRPSPRGGGIIKEEWWGWWQVRPRTLWRMIYVDTAQKKGEENDYSVLQCWGMTDQGRIVLLDQIRDKWEAPDLDRRARQFWNKHRAISDMGPLRQMKVEDKVSGTGLIQALKRPQKLADGGVQPAIPVAAIQRNIDKISRAYSAAPQIEAGNVLLPMDAPWIDDYIAEFNDFPAGAHDDQCDPTFDAIEDMLGGVVKRPPPVGAPEGSFGPSVIEG